MTESSAPLPVSAAEQGETEAGTLREAAERVRASGVLGEAKLKRLFDYLVTNSLAGQTPKEIAIAMDVFDRPAAFDIAQDALVRVYIHKLRRALLDFAKTPEQQALPVLQLPRGEYRLRVAVATVAAAAVVAPGALPVTALPRGGEPPRRRSALLATLIVLACAAGVLAGLAIAAWRGSGHTDLAAVRASAAWSGLLNDQRPILIVVGDYYLIGDTEQSLDVKRLVREFTVNSRSDLDNYLVQHPAMVDRYMDVGLRYLTPSSAFALRDVMALLAPANRRVSVSMLSDLQPGSLASTDIVYIGFFSGLGMLQDLVFAGSRFQIGESYDDILDRKTGQKYVSQFSPQIFGPRRPSGAETGYADYGIFTAFSGPGGNRIVVIAGTRDAGLRQTAAAFTTPGHEDETGELAKLPPSFEALLKVFALDNVNLGGKLLALEPRSTPGGR